MRTAPRTLREEGGTMENLKKPYITPDLTVVRFDVQQTLCLSLQDGDLVPDEGNFGDLFGNIT